MAPGSIILFILTIINLLPSSFSSPCLPINVCAQKSDPDAGLTSTAYICQQDGTKCLASYDNGDCNGDPLDCNTDDDYPKVDWVDCDGSCESYFKIRYYNIADSDATDCSDKDDNDYFEFIGPTGCVDVEGNGNSAARISCTSSSVSEIIYSGDDSCTGNDFSSVIIQQGCDTDNDHTGDYNSIDYGTLYSEIQYCASCNHKPFMFVVLIVLICLFIL